MPQEPRSWRVTAKAAAEAVKNMPTVARAPPKRSPIKSKTTTPAKKNPFYPSLQSRQRELNKAAIWRVWWQVLHSIASALNELTHFDVY